MLNLFIGGGWRCKPCQALTKGGLKELLSLLDIPRALIGLELAIEKIKVLTIYI